MARTPHPQPHPGGDAGGVRRRTHDLNARVRQFVGARHRPDMHGRRRRAARLALLAGAGGQQNRQQRQQQATV